MDTRFGGYGEIWIHDIAAVTTQRLTSGEDVHQPEWSPNGTLLAFTATVGATGEDLFTIPVDGSAPAKAALQAPGNQSDETWTPDGRSLIFLDESGVGMVRVADHAQSHLIADSLSGYGEARASPDGRWFAYASAASERREVYVRRLGGGGGATQISSGGGDEPVWSRDSRHLFYRQDDKLIEATLTASPTLAVASRTLLFAQRLISDGTHTFYDVSPDGKSFVFLKNTEEQPRFVVVLNWK
jgi:Tol biopolymer transport system component